MVRTASIINSEPIILQADSRSSMAARNKAKRLAARQATTPDHADLTDSSHSTAGVRRSAAPNVK